MARIDDDEDDDRPRSRGRGEDDDTEEDDRPRRRKKRRDDDDDWDRGRKPGSGNAGKVILIILAIGFVGVLVCGGIAFLLIMPAVSKVREAAARMNELNNLKLLSLGMLNHQNSTGKLPRADDELSWRVHLLPYIEQDNVYRQFDLNRPWNQGRNQQLGETMIKTYLSPLDEPPTSQTHYRVFTGTGTGFDTNLWKRQFPIFISDGTSNTVMIIETADTVPWPAPKEIPVAGGFPEFGHPNRSVGVVAMFDGSVRTFDKKIASNPATMKALASAAGGEAIGDW